MMIKYLDFMMNVIDKVTSWLLDLHDFVKEQKFLALVEESKMLRDEIDVLEKAEIACEQKQKQLEVALSSLEKELEQYQK